MEEILALRELLLKGDMSGALSIIDELEEMSRDDKINNIRSYAVILILHLIKQKAENFSQSPFRSIDKICMPHKQAWHFSPLLKHKVIPSREMGH